MNSKTGYHYHPDLGFQPSTMKSIMEEMLHAVNKADLGFEFRSIEEFRGTNLFNLVQLFAYQRFRLENQMVEIIDQFFHWMKKTNIRIEPKASGTYQGLRKAFLEATVKDKKTGEDLRFIKGIHIIDSLTKESLMKKKHISLQDRESLNKLESDSIYIILDNLNENDDYHIKPPERDYPRDIDDFSIHPLNHLPEFHSLEKAAIEQVLKNHLPLGVKTKPIPSIYKFRRDTFEVKIPISYSHGAKIDHYISQADILPIKIKILYRCYPDKIIPSGYQDVIKRTFLDSFHRDNTVGRSFNPQSYISTQNLPLCSFVQVHHIIYATNSTMNTTTFQLSNQSIPCPYHSKYIIARTKDWKEKDPDDLNRYDIELEQDSSGDE